jgi:uncharacterized protein
VSALTDAAQPFRGDPESQGWWDALAEGRLMLPRCRRCERFHFPPMPACPHCGAGDHDEVASTGAGAVYSWIVVHRSLDPAFADQVPYTIVTVDLDDGVRMFGRLCGNGGVRAGDRVRLVAVATSEGVLPAFRGDSG